MPCNCGGGEFFCADNGTFEWKTGCQPGGDGGGIRAAGSVCDDAADKWCGEFGDLSLYAKQVDGAIACEMTAFEQDRHNVFFCERTRRVFHCLSIVDSLAEKFGCLVKIGRDERGQRKQMFFVGINRCGFQKWIAARGSDDGLDH